jgi:ribosomal protein S18 acetylase RimI-like enzyme
MRIREATLSDAVAMSHVIVDSFLTAHRGQIPEEVWNSRRQNWTYEVSAQGWERTLKDIADSTNPQECVYVAEGNSGEILGLAMAGPDPDTGPTTGSVYVLYVHPGHQRQGIGRRLVEAVARRLAQQGMTGMTIAVLKANTTFLRGSGRAARRGTADRGCRCAASGSGLHLVESSNTSLNSLVPIPPDMLQWSTTTGTNSCGLSHAFESPEPSNRFARLTAPTRGCGFLRRFSI